MIQELHDNSPMPFGRYKNKAMVNIPAHYLLWLHDQGVTHYGVKQYIISNLDALKKEVAHTKKS